MRDGQVLLHTSLVRKGERLGLTADIENVSSCKVKLKCKLIQIQTFIVESNKNRTCRTVFKASSTPVLSGEKQIMKTLLRIPADLPLSISICNIIKLEYLLKVHNHLSGST